MTALADPDPRSRRRAKSVRYIIALIQAGGGVLGLLFVVPSAWDPTRLGSGIYTAALALGMTAFALSLLAGILLALKMRSGFALSMATQLLQLIALNVPGLSYRFVSGSLLEIGVNVALDGRALEFGSAFNFQLIISQFTLTLSGSANGISISANILALAILVWLRRNASILEVTWPRGGEEATGAEHASTRFEQAL